MPPYSGNVVEVFMEELLFPVSTTKPEKKHLDFDLDSTLSSAYSEDDERHHSKNVSFSCKEDDDEVSYKHHGYAYNPTPPVDIYYSTSSIIKTSTPKQQVVASRSMYNELNERAARREIIQIQQAKQRYRHEILKDKIELENKKKILQSEFAEQRFRYESMVGMHQKQRRLECIRKHQKQMDLQRKKEERKMAAHRHSGSMRYADYVPNQYSHHRGRGCDNTVASSGCNSYDNDSMDSYDVETLGEKFDKLMDSVVDGLSTSLMSLSSTRKRRNRRR